MFRSTVCSAIVTGLLDARPVTSAHTGREPSGEAYGAVRRNVVSVDFTADTLVSRAARELSLKAGQLIHEVERSLRRDVPELWENPDVMASQNVAEHVRAVLSGLEHGAEPGALQGPSEQLARARRLARHGTPVSAMLRAFRLGQSIVLDRLLEEMPRLTDDAELISSASRKVIATASRYVDFTSERGVMAFQEERERRLRSRLSMVNQASMRIGTTLDIARTTQELAYVATERFADLVTVDLLDAALRGDDAPAGGPPVLRRMAQRSVVERDPAVTIPPQRLHTYPDGSPQARALATGQPSRHRLDGPPNGRDTAADHHRTADANPLHSLLVVPLRARDTTLGVAQFLRHRSPDLFDDEDLLLAQEIAARAAMAVDNARRYTHARATALALQRSLLPQRTAEHSAVDVACRYLPAGAQAGVGGDWYDVIPLSGARVALVVGDVVGHGIHAAATMGRLRTAVRTLADIDLPPDELLTHLDDVVIRLSAEASSAEAFTDPDTEPFAAPPAAASADAGAGASAASDTAASTASGAEAFGGSGGAASALPDAGDFGGFGGSDAAGPAGPAGSGVAGSVATDAEVFAGPGVARSSSPDATPGTEGGGDIGATCLYAVYDPVSSRCTLARAGHVLPAVVRPDGTVDILDLPAGPPLGLGGLPFEAAEIDLPEGSLLALYTDGLLEARGHDIEEGLARLRHALAHPAPSLEATCDAVLAALLPARPPDDVALLLARTHGLGVQQVATWDLDADPAAVAGARERVSEQLRTWGLEELDFIAELVVSELVTNAIRYGRPPIRLRLIHDRTLMCEVTDASSTTPHLRRARVLDEGGRGLLLVAQLAEHWGTRHARQGKTVWAELNGSVP